ncbi:poly(A) RNA polymerase GLD2 [Nematolebias whitei]|uniref:poly(A) RNA polymerase GLD2 n=1 Tax=Nematolebias whitei TaxID=451745 RepID=UPI0018988C05|nr:poly(A) RNA polymerase GLD2 [Nematolebias whitei]
MFQRNWTPWRRPAYDNLNPPPQVHPYNQSHPGLEGANRAQKHNQTWIESLGRKRSYHALDNERLPPYEWKPPPLTSTVVPLQMPAITSGHKRQSSDYNSSAVKRQRLDSSPHPSLDSSIRIAHPRCYPEPVESSRASVNGPNHMLSSPLAYPQTQVLSVPESSKSLQLYAKDKLSGQMVELFEACQQQFSDLERKELLRSYLQQEIQKFYRVGRLYLTGSSMNGLGCRSSDADLCLVIMGHKNHRPISVLKNLTRAFRYLSCVERIQLIRAKVPILRFKQKGSDLEFDLNINNTVGIRNTFLLKGYAYADPRIRPLILVIKKWARHHQINDASKGTLSSYTLVLMILHYLQILQEPVLPSLQRAFPDCFDPLMDIDMVPEGCKNSPPYTSKNQSSLGQLLLGFLKYYTTQFSWDKHVISVREAATFPRTKSGEWKNKLICVEEPFERKNVARAVREKHKFDAIKAQFAESCRLLQTTKDLNSIVPVRTIINKELSRR